MQTQSSTKYPSCLTCGSQFPAPVEGKKFNPICASCGSELRLRCDYCGVFYTPKRWVFTTENRNGNQFCSPAHKKRSRIEELSQEKERVRAELFTPRQCARKGAPTAREEKYRVDCPAVFTPVRAKDIFCSDECKDMARYYSDPEKKRNYANRRYAENPLLFTQRARTYRKRKIKRLGVKAVRALENARYPAKKARRDRRLAELLAKAAKVEAFKGGQNKKDAEAASIDELVKQHVKWEAIAVIMNNKTSTNRTLTGYFKLHKRWLEREKLTARAVKN